MKLVFIPGAAGGREDWIYQTEYFAGSEAVALPGHPEGEPFSSIDGYVEWLRGYIRQQQYQDVILVGHSLGGAVAQLYGLKYGEEVGALVLIATGARLKVPPALLAAFKGMIADRDAWRRYVGGIYSRVAPEVGQTAMEARIRIGPEVILNDFLCCDKFDIMDKAHNIKLPTLVISGSQDEMTPVKFAHYLADKIEGSAQVIIEGASHWAFMEKPGEVNQAIEAFIGGLS